MQYIIIALTVIDGMVALLLIGAVLIQQSKDGGFSSSTFGGLGESMFGGQAADHMTKLTVVLVSLFLGLTLLLAVITGRRSSDKGLAEALAESAVKVEKTTVPSTDVAGKDAKTASESAAKETIGGVSKVTPKAAGSIEVKPEKEKTPSKVSVPSAVKDSKAKPAGD